MKRPKIALAAGILFLLMPGRARLESADLKSLVKGEPRLPVIAALDGYGFFVSGITPDGYLTLDRAGCAALLGAAPEARGGLTPRSSRRNRCPCRRR